MLLQAKVRDTRSTEVLLEDGIVKAIELKRCLYRQPVLVDDCVTCSRNITDCERQRTLSLITWGVYCDCSIIIRETNIILKFILLHDYFKLCIFQQW